MREKFVKLMLVVLTGLSMNVSTVHAADALHVAPEIYKLLFDNDRVRVMQVTFPPDASAAEHSHSDHFVYVVSGGTLRFSKPDGTVSDVVANAGEVLWFNRETHSVKNIGGTEVKLVLTDLKYPKR